MAAVSRCSARRPHWLSGAPMEELLGWHKYSAPSGPKTGCSVTWSRTERGRPTMASW